MIEAFRTSSKTVFPTHSNGLHKRSKRPTNEENSHTLFISSMIRPLKIFNGSVLAEYAGYLNLKPNLLLKNIQSFRLLERRCLDVQCIYILRVIFAGVREIFKIFEGVREIFEIF